MRAVLTGDKVMWVQERAVKLSTLDYPKWLLALFLVVLSVVGNIYFNAYPVAIRAVVIIVVLGLSLVMLTTTTHGKIVLDFFKQARGELRKVVWPTRQETVQTTLIVAAIVLVMSLILWGFDSLFAMLVASLVT